MSHGSITNPPTADQAPPAAGAATPPATPPAAAPAAKPTLKEQLEQHKSDPVKLFELAQQAANDLATANHESMTRRQRLEAFELAETQRKQAEDEKKKAQMGDLERAQTEKKELEEKLAASERETALANAKVVFLAAGVEDMKSVELHWKALEDSERAKTTPEFWIAALKQTNSNLFKAEGASDTGPNPMRERTSGRTVPPTVNTHPKTTKEAFDAIKDFREEFSNRA